MNYMKKMSITIKSALITGIFAILAVIVAYILPKIDKIKTTNAPLELNDTEKAKSMIMKYFGYDNVNFHNIVWFDFASKGSNLEFYAVYDNGLVDIVDVFTIRQSFPENLYHSLGQGANLGAYHVTINNRAYFIATSTAGSGSYMIISIYEYDGVGKPNIVHKESDLFQGEIFVIDNSIYLVGNNQRYELKYYKGKFKKVKYRQRLVYDLGSGSHILKYDIKNGKFQIMYDDSQIKFTKISKGQYSSERPISIGFNEQILVDDNLTDSLPSQVRLLTTGEQLSFYPGFFMTLKPNIKGKSSIAISYNYEIWYNIEIAVTD